MWKSYTSLIPPDICWFRHEAHYLSANPTDVPVDPSRRRRCWVDPRASTAASPGDIWSLAPATVITGEYTFIARDDAGVPILLPPDHGQLGNIYSLAALGAIRENAFFWSGFGVPYSVRRSLPDENLALYNFSKNVPAIDYPVEVRTDIIMVPGALARRHGATGTDDIYAIHYQDFIRICRPPATVVATAEKRIQLVQAICIRSDYSAADKLLAIRKVVTDYGTSFA